MNSLATERLWRQKSPVDEDSKCYGKFAKLGRLLYRTNIQESNYVVSKNLAKEWGGDGYRMAGVFDLVRLATFWWHSMLCNYDEISGRREIGGGIRR